MLTIRHLGHARSERLVWLCEELGIPYELALHETMRLFQRVDLRPCPNTLVYPQRIGARPAYQRAIRTSRRC